MIKKILKYLSSIINQDRYSKIKAMTKKSELVWNAFIANTRTHTDKDILDKSKVS